MKLPGGIIFWAITALAFAQPLSFDYNRSKPFDVRHAATETRDGIRIDDLSFAALAGARTEAYLVHSAIKGKSAGTLFVHWYESESPLSNRKQFLQEAVALARHGLTSLLVATPWSDPKWYETRDVTRDYENSIDEVKELRRAFDLLRAQKNVDPQRIALVGHDFGAMYGVLAVTGSKPAAVALQAFAPSFGDWFLYNQRQLSLDQRQRVIDRLAPLDPIRYLPQLGQTPVLLQFADKDFYVPREKAETLHAAAQGPKQILWYESGHGLNDLASRDRQAWLIKTLRLK
jgi:predicted esterase